MTFDTRLASSDFPAGSENAPLVREATRSPAQNRLFPCIPIVLAGLDGSPPPLRDWSARTVVKGGETRYEQQRGRADDAVDRREALRGEAVRGHDGIDATAGGDRRQSHRLLEIERVHQVIRLFVPGGKRRESMETFDELQDRCEIGRLVEDQPSPRVGRDDQRRHAKAVAIAIDLRRSDVVIRAGPVVPRQDGRGTLPQWT